MGNDTCSCTPALEGLLVFSRSESLMKEPFLEPILRRMRIGKVLPFIKRYPDCVLLDIGCGVHYTLLKTLEPYISHGFGIDLKVADVMGPKIAVIRARLDEELPFGDRIFDVVTMLAVLEHLDKPFEILREIERVLKPGGKLLVTVPSRIAQPMLELLSYKLKIIDETEIKDHKRYYNYSDLKALFSKTGLRIDHHGYFQMGMNNMLVATKIGPELISTFASHLG
jgi:2-polyprenyl-3-methyl-5-hydroxy-6-metoxy-1,4-benzoquinol methylase